MLCYVLLGNVLGFDAEGSGLWDDSSYFEGDFSSAYEDIHGERIDLAYLIFLQCEGLPYYGKGGAPHDSRPHWAAFESSCEPFHGPRDCAPSASRERRERERTPHPRTHVIVVVDRM